MIYHLLRLFWKLALFGFFRRVEVEGRDRVPESGPLLLVPNHTNALVDPLVILVQLERPVTLTAKSTLAGNPLLGILMRAARVITFHRSQDRSLGADPSLNAAAFAECRKQLKKGAAICIFPEGVSHSDPVLRPFRTGAARIALEYLERDSNRGGLKIVPVGLHFEAKDRFRSTARVEFGPPIDLASWRSANPNADAAELTGKIERAVRTLTLNFSAPARSELFTWAAEIVATGGKPPAPLGRDNDLALSERVRLIKRLQAGYDSLVGERSSELMALERQITDYRQELERLGVAPHEVYLPLHGGRAAFFVLREMELSLVGLPLALCGVLTHIVPYWIVRTATRRMSTERDHVASNALFVSLLVFPCCYALQLAAAWLLLSTLGAVVYSLVLPYTGAFAVVYMDRVRGTWVRTKTFVRFVRDRSLQRRLIAEGGTIIAAVQRLNDELGEDTHALDP